MCAFLRPGEVVLAWTDNKDDPQYELSHQSLSYLENVRDAKGRKLVIHKLPIPDHPICITKEDLDGYTFEEGEDMREVGERLAASYVNFYFSNDANHFASCLAVKIRKAMSELCSLCSSGIQTER